MNDPKCFSDPEATRILEDLCQKHDVDQQLLRELCEVTDEYVGSGRKHGITKDVQNLIDDFRDRQQKERKTDAFS